MPQDREPRPCRRCGLPLDPRPPGAIGRPSLVHPACVDAMRPERQAGYNRKAAAAAVATREKWRRSAEEAARAG